MRMTDPEILRLHDKVDALALRLDQRYQDQTKALDAAFVAAEKAVRVANDANEKRLDNVNEFRGQQRDIISNFVPRAEYQVVYTALSEKIEALSSRLDTNQGNTAGQDKTTALTEAKLNQRLVVYGVIISIVVVIVNVVIALVR
jgi:hypothetical protein